MINVSHEEYEYKKNDELIDALSGITNFACNMGEILGPILSSLLTELYGFNTSTTVLTICYLMFGCFFIVSSGLLKTRTIISIGSDRFISLENLDNNRSISMLN